MKRKKWIGDNKERKVIQTIKARPQKIPSNRIWQQKKDNEEKQTRSFRTWRNKLTDSRQWNHKPNNVRK